MLWPVAVFWALAAVSLHGPPVGLVYALFAAMPFGALAVVPPELVGGLTLTPAPVVAALLVARCLGTAEGRRWFACACRSVEHFAPLLGFWAVAVLTTLVAPRLFGGSVEVVPLRGSGLGPDATVPLSPSLQQVSQLGYVTLSVFVVIATARLLRAEGTRRHVVHAMLLGGAVTVLSGLLDGLLTRVGAPDVLEALRTAGYTIAAESWSGAPEARPLSGLMPDPTGFGALCTMFAAALWFHRRVARGSFVRTVAIPGACLLLALMAWRSMSVAAWTGLLLVAAAGVAEALWRRRRRWGRGRGRGWIKRGRTERGGRESGARRFALLSLVALALFASSGPLYERAAAVLGRALPADVPAAAGPSRADLGTVTLGGVLDTGGLGLGLGSTRAPDAFLALLGGVGVLGTLCCAGFLAMLWAGRPSGRRTRGLVWWTAYRWSASCLVAVWLLSDASASFGPYLALLFGASVALQRGDRVERLLQADAVAGRRNAHLAEPRRRRRSEWPRWPEGKGRTGPSSVADAVRAVTRSGTPVGPPRAPRRPPVRFGPVRHVADFDVRAVRAFDLGEPDPPARTRARLSDPASGRTVIAADLRPDDPVRPPTTPARRRPRRPGCMDIELA